jgi:hypothetical protein
MKKMKEKRVYTEEQKKKMEQRRQQRDLATMKRNEEKDRKSEETERRKEEAEEKKRSTIEARNHLVLSRSLTKETIDLELLLAEAPFFKVNEENLDSKCQAIRFLLRGNTAGQVKSWFAGEPRTSLRLTDIEWENLSWRVYEKVSDEAENLLKAQRAKFVGGKIPILEVDCRWATKGYDAHEATISAFTAPEGELVMVVNLFREGPHKNCTLDAKGMEGYGVQKIAKRLKKEGITVEHLLHDDDSSSINNARSIFPDLKELLCINHATKAVG